MLEESDFKTAVALIDRAAERGIIAGNELSVIGTLRARAIMSIQALQAKANENANDDEAELLLED